MAACNCGSNAGSGAVSPRFRKALWIALAVNASMFVVETVAGLTSGSVALWADALDFAGDAANYGISLLVLSLGLAWRARAALFKGASMLGFGVFVLTRTLWSLLHGVPPEPLTMGVVGLFALLANLRVAVLLYTFREGDANMQSVWLCSRNDAIGNVAVMLAAAGVMGSGSVLPDVAVAAVMAGLALSSGLAIVRQSRMELATVLPR
ncbi:MAG: zinc transporter ZitB [Candidatus Accumulibacter adjunctus]|uniref:Zinc transporter ZitB n=1 Tax=Candidatus Accumulibacter adjunctus TaxID=1454001 RepID=A0A011MC06_9PROT|nr:MAG: zinc transporter ZitB [Candidatus Accumulibacter adjunctus]